VSICDSKKIQKSLSLQKGINRVKNFVYRPPLSLVLGGGHTQTMMTMPKDILLKMLQKPYEFDKREIYVLSDGGSIALDFKGNFKQPSND
jgi:hypothetical protein